ncbi:endonuclease III-like protein 1 [Drosophila tropicalis]|uniref:endonuclease III-like protein 1 n=1 Tax=Drosophila tropicalis TaxID=46794 RepID=UPI0035AB853F
MSKIPKNTNKLSLASKLAKKHIIKPTRIIGKQNQNDNDQDIEDLVQESRYFSPVQTRKQRQPKTIKKELPATPPPVKKSRESQDKKEEDSQVSKIPMGTATIVKCQVVADEKIKLEVESPNALWEQQLQNIRLMRQSASAPVDTMGCHKCADQDADEKTQRFQNFVALMLSSQTKDETTFKAMKRLKARNLSPGNIKDMPTSELEGLLHPVSFYKNKAKYLKQTSEVLLDKYGGDIPDNVKDLIALPGVGPKMAHICMSVAWQKITGIGVDVHVHRISNRLGWLKAATKEPEQTRQGLEKWLPQPLWSEVNHLFVGFGQTICTPVKPNCAQCLNRDICPSAYKNETKSKKK